MGYELPESFVSTLPCRHSCLLFVVKQARCILVDNPFSTLNMNKAGLRQAASASENLLVKETFRLQGDDDDGKLQGVKSYKMSLSEFQSYEDMVI
jgi:hypothetical protein